MNRVDLIGNVGRTPDIRTTQGGITVVHFSLATSERWKDKDGERQEKTTWHDCVAFGALCKVIENWVDKGTKIYVSGRLQKRKYKTREGNDREAVEVVVQELELIGSKPRDARKDDVGDDAEERPRRPAASSGYAKRKPERETFDLDDEEEERPRRRSSAKTEDELDDEVPF